MFEGDDAKDARNHPPVIANATMLDREVHGGAALTVVVFPRLQFDAT